MDKLKQKITYLLSDPSISDKEFKDLIYWLQTGGIEEVDAKVRKIRNIIKKNMINEHEIIFEISLDGKDGFKQSKNMRADGNLNELHRLLLDETNLSKNEAMMLLADYFKIPYNPNNHISFNKWISNLANNFSWPEIIHVAYTIRNKNVHMNDENPWPLRNYE